jgi:hypothetical protein
METFRNPAQGTVMDFHDVDPVRWDGGDRPQNLLPNYVTNTDNMLKQIRLRQDEIREDYPFMQALRAQLASIPRMPTEHEISQRDAQMGRNREATRAAAEEEDGQSSRRRRGRTPQF